MEGPAKDFVSHFSVIRGPRIERNKRHRLESILFIVLCAVLSCIESWEGMEEYGEARKEWLSKYVDLSNGTPSADTFGRVFAQIAAAELSRSLTLK